MSIPFYENKFHSLVASDCHSLSFRPHLHNLIECVYVVEGEIEIHIGQKRRRLQEGEMAVIFPNLVHSYYSEEQYPNFCEFFFYPLQTNSPLYGLVQGNQPENPFLTPANIQPDIPKQFHELVTLYQLEKPDFLLMKTLMELILLRSLEHLKLAKLPYSESENLTANAVTYFTEHFKSNISLEETAKYLGVSKYHLSRTLNRSLGMSISSYINQLRTDYAKTLLVSTDFSISDIASQSGYDNLRTFNRCFKQFAGVSPKDFRNMAIK